jgi:hypothetical protein
VIDIGLTEIAFAGAILAAWKKSSKRGKLTPEREKIFVEALENIKVDRASSDPDVASGKRAKEMFHKLADAYQKQGLTIQANILRKRGDLLGASQEDKDKRRALYDKAIVSFNTSPMLTIAQHFEDLTATGAADTIRKRVKDIQVGKIKKPADAPYDTASKVEAEVPAHIPAVSPDVVPQNVSVHGDK